MLTFDFLCAVLNERGFMSKAIVNDMIRAINSVGAQRYRNIDEMKLHFQAVEEATQAFNREVQMIVST